jgi:hypothetical protein
MVSFTIKDDLKIRFCEDKWLDNATLREQYPALYDTVCYNGDTIAMVLEYSPPNTMFGRHLVCPRLKSWNDLLQR